MSWLVAPDTWTDFLPAAEVAEAIRAAWPAPAAAHPLSDGGLGCGPVLAQALGTQALPVSGRGADLEPRELRVWPLRGAVFVESAEALGRHTCPPSPMDASSAGLGGLLRAMAARSDGPLIVGLGGSGTMDGGLGLAQALGLVVFDDSGAPLPPGAGAAQLAKVARVTGSPPLRDHLVRVWADVRTPLLDSPRVFGPQKGASAADIAHVEAGLKRWSAALARWRAEKGLGPLDLSLPGGGAAGGLGFALAALADAPVLEGAREVARVTQLDTSLTGVSGVITGEGRVDPTSFQGKVVGEVIRAARARGVAQVAVLCGQIRGPVPPPPVGPDLLLACEDMPGADRRAQLSAGVAALAAQAGVG